MRQTQRTHRILNGDLVGNPKKCRRHLVTMKLCLVYFGNIRSAGSTLKTNQWRSESPFSLTALAFRLPGFAFQHRHGRGIILGVAQTDQQLTRTAGFVKQLAFAM